MFTLATNIIKKHTYTHATFLDGSDLDNYPLRQGEFQDKYEHPSTQRTGIGEPGGHNISAVLSR